MFLQSRHNVDIGTLKSDPHLASAFQTLPRYFYKQSSNLRDFLVKSDLPKKPTYFLSQIPCGNFPGSQLCTLLLHD